MKNTIHTYILPAILSATLITTSCSHFEEMNIDPNNIDVVVPNSLMNPLLYDMGTFSSNRNYDFTWQLMQVGFPYPATATGVHRYDITPTAGNGTWNKGYTWLRSISEMEEAAINKEQPIYLAVAKTLKAYSAGMLTDAFGDMPFGEAIKLDEGISTPKFDEQQEIYRVLIEGLEEANSIYASTDSEMSGGDILFGNSGANNENISPKEKWRKFNNSLLMRLLLRTSKRTEIDSYNRLKEIMDAPDRYPVFNSNAEAAILKISGLSPFNYAWNRRQDYTLTITKAEFFVDMLNDYEDPRRPFFMSEANSIPPGTNLGYKGIPAAHDPAATFNFTPSIPNPDLMIPQNLGTVIHEIIMPYAEVEFIKSEVYLHFGDLENAEEAYKKGTIAGITQWVGISSPGETYFDNPLTAFNGTLERIMNQKYLALYMCDYQQWFEYRRTGFPVLPKTEHMLHGGEMPKRFMYHDRLSITNPENYKIASDKLEHGDSPLSRVWWEK
ncbi:SusD/RagB family nutrient-binding outer membrane lipoprotein [Sphingobacterium corticibacterium]|uniref:SusD/RagB family nutrient-binding outer membrane lipoprotein n=1 Tax=Sphingobacterium corticibacterium TaxID=2484746 RepID=A0A4Q6XU89_9SPHI|nr:SusD/RagB family nutrient-binding outer membrane lipoprotein [Sphingobacterium corticibacterium]RZF59916.1 SusD/RagB family nutrient-binding outer membrane lipoprotein [Sphingobacterium corticibacterium]